MIETGVFFNFVNKIQTYIPALIAAMSPMCLQQMPLSNLFTQH